VIAALLVFCLRQPRERVAYPPPTAEAMAEKHEVSSHGPGLRYPEPEVEEINSGNVIGDY